MAFRPHGQGSGRGHREPPSGNNYPPENYHEQCTHCGQLIGATNHGVPTSVYIGPNGPVHQSSNYGPNTNGWTNIPGQGQLLPHPPIFHPIPPPGPHFIALHGYKMRTVRSDDEEGRILYSILEPTGDQIHVPSGHPHGDPALGPAMYFPAPTHVVVPTEAAPHQPHHQPTTPAPTHTQFYGPDFQNQPIWPQHGQHIPEPEIPVCCAGNWSQDPSVQYTDRAQGQFQPDSGQYFQHQQVSDTQCQYFPYDQEQRVEEIGRFETGTGNHSGQQNVEISEQHENVESESWADEDYDGDISSGLEFESRCPAENEARQEFLKLLEDSGIVRSGDFDKMGEHGKR